MIALSMDLWTLQTNSPCLIMEQIRLIDVIYFFSFF